jgi:hypothetical protein
LNGRIWIQKPIPKKIDSFSSTCNVKNLTLIERINSEFERNRERNILSQLIEEKTLRK